MTKLPWLKGRELIAALRKAGFEVARVSLGQVALNIRCSRPASAAAPAGG